MIAVTLAIASCDRSASELDYSALSSLRSLGLAYLEEGRPSEAAREFALLAEQAPDEPLGPANLAVAELRRGSLDAALEAVAEARRRAPNDPDVLFIEATILSALKRRRSGRTLATRLARGHASSA